jgi:cytochrome d ubiquinol oxidase subunit I
MHQVITSPLALTVARAQFGFTVAFHIIFPAFSIGLAAYLAVTNAAWVFTRKQVYLDIFKYWVKIFAVVFSIGVVSGLVMEYQIAFAWSGFTGSVGPVLGPLFAYEVVSAFFLEAGFLGIMLFGRKRVGEKLHLLATCMVSLGTTISMGWILTANSWMQSPTGFTIGKDGRFIPHNWFDVVFNPTSPYEWSHMGLAAYISTAMVVSAVASFHLLRNSQNPVTRKMFSMAMWMLVIVLPCQAFIGDSAGREVWQTQPIKLAAMEGDFNTNAGQALHLFGWPVRETDGKGRLLWDLKIPHLGSYIVTHNGKGVIEGLNSYPQRDWPVLWTTFWGFRIMVGLWTLMLAYSLYGLYSRYRRDFYTRKYLHWAGMALGPAGFATIIAGWITTETGRQPWLVYGVLRTSQAVAPLTVGQVVWSLAVIVIIYFAVFGTGIVYILRMMGREPQVGEPEPRNDKPLRAAGRHKLHQPEQRPDPQPAE